MSQDRMQLFHKYGYWIDLGSIKNFYWFLIMKGSNDFFKFFLQNLEKLGAHSAGLTLVSYIGPLLQSSLLENCCFLFCYEFNDSFKKSQLIIKPL
jgi:hypothetical protein